MLGQLAAGIAHDFNNILTAVHGGAALIGQNPGDAETVLRTAGVIMDAAGRGKTVTRRLLGFTRREEGRPRRVDPQAVLEAVSELAEHTLGRAILVNIEASAGLPPLMADQAELETALMNLAINARDAMPAGGLLTLAAAAESVAENAAHPAGLRPGAYIRMAVKDTGSGIDPRMLPQVLEPFFTTKAHGQGSGLGLPMAKAFAEQSGGGMTIDSAPGWGTTVSLWLPSAAPPEPDVIAVLPGRKRILLAEGDPMVSETLAAFLDDAGFAVKTAANGAEALEALRSPLRVDALVTDLSIPEMGGLKLIDEAQRAIRGLPVVLLTASLDQDTKLATQGAVSGKFSLLRKPVSLASLVDRIEALIADAPR
jgi:CheY-like chemotaxis protein